jgi:hypothetical protein
MRGRPPRSGFALRAVVFLGPVIALLAGVPQGLTPPVWLLLVVAAVALGSAVVPEHYVGSVALVLVLAWWVIDVRDGLPLSAVAAAGALLAGHLAATVAAYGPERMAPERPVVLLWVRRGVLVWLASVLTWVVVDAEQGRATSAAYWVGGLAVGLGLTVLASAVYPVSDERGPST